MTTYAYRVLSSWSSSSKDSRGRTFLRVVIRSRAPCKRGCALGGLAYHSRLHSRLADWIIDSLPTKRPCRRLEGVMIALHQSQPTKTYPLLLGLKFLVPTSNFQLPTSNFVKMDPVQASTTCQQPRWGRQGGSKSQTVLSGGSDARFFPTAKQYQETQAVLIVNYPLLDDGFAPRLDSLHVQPTA